MDEFEKVLSGVGLTTHILTQSGLRVFRAVQDYRDPRYNPSVDLFKDKHWMYYGSDGRYVTAGDGVASLTEFLASQKGGN